MRPALRAARPRFAALLSSCAQGSALLISSVSLCQRERSALFLTQLAAHLSPLRRSFVPPLQRRLPSGTPEFRLQNSILAAPPCREAGRGPRGNWFPLESRSRILCATVTAASVTAISSHASHACAAGRHLLRLSMCARHCVPSAHASLRICLPAHTARTLYVVTPRTRVRAVDICSVSACAPGALRRTPTLRSAYVFLHTRLGAGPSRLARVCGRVGIPSVSLCQYERCALFLPQLASGDTSPAHTARRWFLCTLMLPRMR